MTSPCPTAVLTHPLRAFAWTLLLLGAAALPAQERDDREPGTAAPRPHVVVILADDLGWKDVGYHGGEIETPHIDRLAASGVRLEQFYVQPVCSPTRASFLTGRYPIRQGLQVGVIRPFADYGLPLAERTLAQALKDAGYRTAITGKWHLGLHEPDYLPTRRGFDHQYGHYVGALDYYTHVRDGGYDWHRDDKVLREEGYTTDLIAREAVRLIEGHDTGTGEARSLFLYVAFNAPHTPLQAPARYVERYAHIADERRRIYAAMVTCMDEAIGRILAALEEKNIRRDTLVFFASDNGGPTGRQGADNGPLRGRKGTLYEGGVRVPAIASWPARIAAGREYRGLLHVVDLYPTLLGFAGAAREQELPLDGLDAGAALERGAPSPRTEVLHNLTPARAALRRGDWKIVVAGARGGSITEAREVELFHIADDPTESRDLSASRPEKVRELLARLAEFERAAVAPKGGAGRAPAGFEVPRVWGEKDATP